MAKITIILTEDQHFRFGTAKLKRKKSFQTLFIEGMEMLIREPAQDTVEPPKATERNAGQFTANADHTPYYENLQYILKQGTPTDIKRTAKILNLLREEVQEAKPRPKRKPGK